MCDVCFLFSGLAIEILKRETKVTDEQLDTTIEEIDLPKLSSYFDNTGDYVEMLGLSPGQQTDVIEEKARTALNRTQAGIKLALKYWLERVLAEGTFRALLLILLSLDKGDVAINVAQYLSDKGESSCEGGYTQSICIHVGSLETRRSFTDRTPGQVPM